MQKRRVYSVWCAYIEFVEIGPRGYGLVPRMDNHGDQKVSEDRRAERSNGCVRICNTLGRAMHKDTACVGNSKRGCMYI